MANLVDRDRAEWPARLGIRRSDGARMSYVVVDREHAERLIDAAHEQAPEARLTVSITWSEAALVSEEFRP